MAEGLQKKNLDTSADETRTFDHGVMKTATVGDFEVAREWLEPGWKWSEDIKPIVGTDSYQFQHYGVLLSGRMKVVADDGSEMEVGPGDAYSIPRGTMPGSLVMNPLPALSSPVRRWSGLPRGKYSSPIMRRT
jgi:mannose-6-phosphate isomerase-like protein (cupin superfamily)